MRHTPRQPNEHSINLIRSLCEIAGPKDLIEHQREQLRQIGIVAAVRNHDTPALFDWLLSTLSLQGISDEVAVNYIEEHGILSWAEISNALDGKPACGKLRGHWTFYDCRYHKGTKTCSEPDHISGCPLPRANLRNGRLNQTAFSLYLFIRDVMDGDLVAWIDERLSQATRNAEGDVSVAPIDTLIEPLRAVYGVSDKVLSMALAMLLIGAGRDRPNWLSAGVNAIAVDTLVHNWLTRSGILRQMNAEHAYGPACFTPTGCTGVLRQISDKVDASPFGRAYPIHFPRFIQSSVWRFCAADGMYVCNGNQIDDSNPCRKTECPLFGQCARRPLKSRKKPKNRRI